jgi:capsular exopolysaccharide synthesis family protein
MGLSGGIGVREMQQDQLRKLVRRWTIPVILLTVLGAGFAFFLSHRITPIYEAKGDLLVSGGPALSTDGVSISATQAAATAASLLTEPPILQRVVRELHLNINADALAKEVSATPQTNTQLLDITVRDPSPQRAADIANTLMGDYVDQVNTQNNQRVAQAGAALQAQITAVQATLSQQDQQLAAAQTAKQDTTSIQAAISANSALLSQLVLAYGSFKASQAQSLETVSVVAPANVPSRPSSPITALNTTIGAVIGFLVGLGLLALVQYLDRGLKSPEDVHEHLGVACLGVIPRYRELKARGRRRGKKSDRHNEAVLEAYRRLRANLLFSTPDAALRSVVVTSVRPGEGKTTTAANLAVAMAAAESRVLLLDADLRNPDQHRIFDKTLEGGFTDMVMQSPVTLPPTLNGAHSTQFDNLSLLTSGTVPPSPAELLASKRAHDFLRWLTFQQDVIVIDTPPAGIVTDPLSVAAEATATILVVEAGKTNASQAAQVIEALNRVGAHVAGVVLNKAAVRGLAGYYYRRGYYRAGERRKHAAPPVASAGKESLS